MGRYLNIAKNALKHNKYYQEEPFLPGEQAPPITTTNYEITKKDEISPSGDVGTCKARLIGKDMVADCVNPDPCWHCDSAGKCGCADCGEYNKNRNWGPGRCGACLGAGFLAWESNAAHGGKGRVQ